MPIHLSHMKERLSVAYVAGVVARAGATYAVDELDYGIDIRVFRVRELQNGRFAPTGHGVHCQIKATTTYRFQGTDVVYDLEADAYNRIVEFEGGTCILILMCLPADERRWLSLDEEQFVLKNCCYWTCLQGEATSNTSRIRIPRSNVFTPDVVQDLLDQVRRGVLC